MSGALGGDEDRRCRLLSEIVMDDRIVSIKRTGQASQQKLE